MRWVSIILRWKANPPVVAPREFDMSQPWLAERKDAKMPKAPRLDEDKTSTGASS